MSESNDARVESTVWRLRSSTGVGTADCIATDWWGQLVAHRVSGELGAALTEAISSGLSLDAVQQQRPDLAVDPVRDDLQHEPPSPVSAQTVDGARRSVLALDPFSTGCWQVETISGSRHILDLTGGGYRRISDQGFDDMTADWYGIEPLHVWPSTNSSFTVQLFPDNVPEDPRSIDEATLRAIFEAAPFLTSAFVTRIVEISPEEADAGGLDELHPVSHFEMLCAAPPRNAWLLMADERSPIDLAEVNEAGELWTTPKQVQRGDLALFYYTAPNKAVLYAARVASQPVYQDPEAEESLEEFPHQWWSGVDAFVELDPVPYAKLRDYFGGQLVLRGRGGRYVPPWVVTQLIMDQRSAPAKDLVLQVPTGHDDLPVDNLSLTLEQWRELASGAFTFEVDVERYVVEPLLQWLTEGEGERSWSSKTKLGPLVPDYSLHNGTRLSAVVEVKLGVRGSSQGNTFAGPDVRQLCRYTAAGRVPGILVDANRILLFDAGDPVPVEVFERSRLSLAQLAHIKRHAFPKGDAEEAAG